MAKEGTGEKAKEGAGEAAGGGDRYAVDVFDESWSRECRPVSSS